MKNNNIVKILIERDCYSLEDAIFAVNDVKKRLFNGELDDAEDILMEEFGLEPDYIFDLLDF